MVKHNGVWKCARLRTAASSPDLQYFFSYTNLFPLFSRGEFSHELRSTVHTTVRMVGTQCSDPVIFPNA